MADKHLTIEGAEPLLLFGFNDIYLRRIEAAFPETSITARGNRVILKGKEAKLQQIEHVLSELILLLNRNGNLTENDVETVLALSTAKDGPARSGSPGARDVVLFTPNGGMIKAKTPGQARLVEEARGNDIAFAVGPAGTGKCVVGSTLVLTGDGLIPIEELAAGTASGATRRERIPVTTLRGPAWTSHVYNGGLSPTLRLTTRHGFEIEGTPEHPLLTLTPEGRYAWKRLEDLDVGDFVGLQRGTQVFGRSVAVDFTYSRRPSDYSSRDVRLSELDTEFAYFMGLAVGDGCLRRYPDRVNGALVALSTADAEVGAHVEATADRFGLHAPRHGYDYRIRSTQLYGLLTHLGVEDAPAHEKRVPPTILRSPKPQVVAFLQGLFDADGTVDRRSGSVSLSTASESLAREVQLLLLNLGIVAVLRRKATTHRDSFTVEAYGEDAERFFEEVGFRLARKQRRRRLRACRNPNLDVVPHVSALIDEAVRARTLTRAQHRSLYDYRIGRRRPSYAKLQELIGVLGDDDEPVRRLRRICRDRLLWSPITDRQAGFGQVYDLTVPGEHNFVAGGFANHNTYLAVALAVSAMKSRQVKRIVLSRPAVEAGERLGFLPGDFREKIDPYLRPLYDALEDMIPREKLSAYMDQNIVEIVPLAFMRGRAQPLSSSVLTPAGFRPMGSLQVGDDVIGSDGRPTRVEGVYPQGVREVYEVTMSDGSRTRCCGEHLWTVYTPSDKRRSTGPRLLRTDEMIGRLRCYHNHRYEVPLFSAPVAFPAQEVPVDPYALGLLLGDGCLTGVGALSFATADAELVEALDERLEGVAVKPRAGYDYYLSKPGYSAGGGLNPLGVALREVGLYGTYSYTKFIPKRYLYNTPDVRLALLQGLLDTDGGPVTQAGRTCRIQYSTTSPKLRDDVLFLVRSLGGAATWRTRPARGRRPGGTADRPVHHRRDAYILNIRLPEGIAPFQLERKAAVYAQHGGGRPMRFIHRIERVGTEPTQCIRVAAADSLYATDDFILTHNTLNSAFVILDEAQNATTQQMKMFLTRLGANSRAIITGDVTQTDLPTRGQSGLVQAQRILEGVDGIAFVQFDRGDVVRHRLVKDIIEAYERHEQEEGAASS